MDLVALPETLAEPGPAALGDRVEVVREQVEHARAGMRAHAAVGRLHREHVIGEESPTLGDHVAGRGALPGARRGRRFRSGAPRPRHRRRAGPRGRAASRAAGASARQAASRACHGGPSGQRRCALRCRPATPGACRAPTAAHAVTASARRARRAGTGGRRERPLEDQLTVLGGGPPLVERGGVGPLRPSTVGRPSPG